MASRTSEYYKKNPEAAEKRRAYQREYNKSATAKKKRASCNKARKDLGLKKGDPRDASHKTKMTKGGKKVSYVTKENRSKNRGSKSNMPGDKRARGGKKKR